MECAKMGKRMEGRGEELLHSLAPHPWPHFQRLAPEVRRIHPSSLPSSISSIEEGRGGAAATFNREPFTLSNANKPRWREGGRDWKGQGPLRMKKKLSRKEGEEAREAEEGTRNPVRKKLIGERGKDD
jgi:hypothetical protein